MTPLLDTASLRSRLRDTRGFMIAEQLASIVFIGLLCVAVGVGLQVAMNSYTSITRQAQADALLQQAVEVVSDELTYARDVENSGAQTDGNPLYFTSPTRHEPAVLQSRDAGEDGIEDGIWLNAAGEQSQIVPARDGLAPKLAELSYNADNETWSFRITIASGEDVAAETAMTVKRIGS